MSEIALISAVVFFLFVGYGVSFILSTREDVTGFTGGSGETSSGDRLLAWVAAIKMAKDYPAFGVGWGKFEENVRNYGHDKKVIAHNTILSVLAETGLFGLACFVGALYCVFRQLWMIRRKWRENEDKRDFLILSQGVLASFVTFVVVSSFSVKDHDPAYWAMLAIAGGLCNIYRRETQASASAAR